MGATVAVLDHSPDGIAEDTVVAPDRAADVLLAPLAPCAVGDHTVAAASAAFACTFAAATSAASLGFLLDIPYTQLAELDELPMLLECSRPLEACVDRAVFT